MLVNEKETWNSEISSEKNQTAILCQVMVFRTFLSQNESLRPTSPVEIRSPTFGPKNWPPESSRADGQGNHDERLSEMNVGQSCIQHQIWHYQ